VLKAPGSRYESKSAVRSVWYVTPCDIAQRHS
jgi:hypothetical protein